MKMTNEIVIAASAERIFYFASRTERWPEWLSHYRYVHVLSERNGERTVEMAARRGWIPVRWRALQYNDSRTPRIRFRHVAGWTRGMDVEWQFEPREDATLVRIVHDLTFRFPAVARFLERRIVGDFFIHSIANRTLARFKELSESHR
ncbi:MAG: SRPBCC family protein [Candidatus Eremiobacteraeota bacterium]|nr:SRPBCC family protein [Candidatus Eremiobacteraeota bacterium]